MDISKEVVLVWALPVLTILAIIIRIISIKKHCPPSEAATSNLQLTDPSCSSSSSSTPTWDVFLSFHGKDTRSNFTSHLYHALDQAGILTFIDDHALEKGQKISSALLDAIRNSNMFIVVLSENYASSRWCLDELVEILSCNRMKNQVVPVFYYVDPSDVRHQKGSFRIAFDYHKKNYSIDMIEKWKSALSEIAKLSGHHIRKEANEKESETIQKIVGNVAPQASMKMLHLEKYLFGIESAIEEIYQKLCFESNDVRAIVICGMGGIGKTTIAKAFYNRYFNKFHISCFSVSITQYSAGGSPLLQLLQQLLVDLLRTKDYKVLDVESGIRKLKHILHSKKALIVLDDLDQSNYSELQASLGNLFSVGSRIIITTRDANLLNKLKVDISEADIYMVKTLRQIESLQLFSYHAFGKPVPPKSFKELSSSFVTHAGGLPLALKVLGSSLLGRTHLSFWIDKLDKVKAIPENDIQKILLLSYDELDDETQKAIFLDVAFFFIGKDKDEAADVFKSCHFFPVVGIQILMDRCLLTVDEDNKFRMHNLIQELGRELGKIAHTRLFMRGNDCKNSKYIEGANNIEGLVLDLRGSTDGQMPFLLFERMSNLRLLQIIGARDTKGDFKNLFPQLRCIRWHCSPWTHIPSTFCPNNLIFIDMPFSKFKILWKDPMHIKLLNNLVYLNLSKCDDLQRLSEQLGEMKALKMIDVSFTAITKLPDSITQLKNLVELNLYSCKKLRKIPLQIGNMRGLRIFDASYTAIEQLPDSFVCLINLERLTLYMCKNLRNLPDNICKLKLLQRLELSWCSKLEQLPKQLGDMQCLEYLFANCSAIEEVPDSIGLLSRLRMLNLDGCKKLKYVPESVWNLTSIEYFYLDSGDIGINTLPDSVERLNNLTTLELSCNLRLCLPVILCFPSLQKLTLTDEGQISSSAEPISISNLFNLRVLRMNKCTSLWSSLPELPLNLEEFYLCEHRYLERLPDLSSLKLLKRLDIWRCTSLQSISLLPSHLQILSVEECTSLQVLPDLSMLKALVSLRVFCCNNLKSISLKQSSLQARRRHFPFRAKLPNREVAEWFNYKSSGHTVSFDIPPSSGPDILGLALWVVYTCKAPVENYSYIRALITNYTECVTENYNIYLDTHSLGGEAQSSVQCITGDKMPMRSGDRMKVSFKSLLYSAYGVDEVSTGAVKFKMCGVHVIEDKPSIPVY